MEERKKQILLEKLTEYNKTVNDISKFQLNKREENLFCEIMQQFADEYYSKQLHQYNVVQQSEQFYCVSSNALVYGKPCEKWCGDENCKALCKQ